MRNTITINKKGVINDQIINTLTKPCGTSKDLIKNNPVMNIPFAKVPLAGNEFNYVNEVLKSGWLTTSSKALQFERLFAGFVGAKYACTVNSCTSALHLAVEALGIKKDDKVLVPSLTFTASAEVLRYIGADPVFMDVEYGTGLISPSILRKTLKANTDVKAIILVHYGGQSLVMTSADGEGIIDICRQNNIRIIEDAAHAFPTKFENRFIGSFGDVTCFSFYANKTITTGEGGMLVTDDENIYKRAKTMRLHGINRDIWDRFTSNHSSWEYDVIAPGFKYNMPDINAAVGLAQLEKADFFRDQRQSCASYYFHELKNIQVIDLPVCTGPMENHSWHLFPITIRPEAPVSRNEFIKLLAKEGIGTSVHYKPLHRMTYYKETYHLNPEDFPNTERIWNGTVSLPIYPDLKDDELKYICQTIKRILNQK
jgi:dTDP-4-amino-4,6-dideoxygalactose transaminase